MTTNLVNALGISHRANEDRRSYRPAVVFNLASDAVSRLIRKDFGMPYIAEMDSAIADAMMAQGITSISNVETTNVRAMTMRGCARIF
jgi:C4-type Zn-finger protein